MPTTDQFSRGRRPKILVVEDNPAVREFIVRALSLDGYDLAAAIDGRQALDMLEMDRFDLLVSDIVMPNVDGIELAQKASMEYPNLKIVMVSGYSQERVRAHNLDSLVHRVVAKPFSLEEICEAVKNTLFMNDGKREKEDETTRS